MKKIDIIESLNNIDESVLESHFSRRESLAAQSRSASGAHAARRPGFKRILAASAAAALVTVGAVFAVASLGKPAEPPAAVSDTPSVQISAPDEFTVPADAVLPPTRRGKGESRATLAKDYNLKELYEDCDLVAVVRVLDWLRDDEFCTQYDAELLKVYKGDGSDGEHILLQQDGYSKSTFPAFPLFTYGDEMLLFMKIGTENDGAKVYWMPGSFTTTIDVVRIDGTTYFIDRFGMCLSDKQRFKAATGKDEFRPQSKLADEIIDYFSKRDEVLASIYSVRFAHIDDVPPFFALTEEEMTRYFEMFKG